MNLVPYRGNDTLAREPKRAVHSADHAREQRRRRIAKQLGLGLLATVAGVVTVSTWSHVSRHAETPAMLGAEHAAVPMVRTALVELVNALRNIDLPGNVQASDSVALYAEAAGYIRTRNVDIGSHVRAGDELAAIAARDVSQELAQARVQLARMRAAVALAVAKMDLARTTGSHATWLSQNGWADAQQGDTDRFGATSPTAALAVARANLGTQQAAVNWLQQLTGLHHVVAPFNGVITATQVDVGSLVTADAASGSPLFSIERTDQVRVRVDVPRDAFLGLRDGDPAEVTVPELPGRVFKGSVRARSSQQPASMTEVDVNNADGILTPGVHGMVHLKQPRTQPVALVPSQAVVFDKNGPSAVVYENGQARLRHLDLESGEGIQLVVRAGLRQGDLLILNPPAGVVEGMTVRTMVPPNVVRRAELE